MIILDVSALIALLDSEDGHHDVVTSQLRSRATERWVTASLTLAEVMVRAAEDDDLLAQLAEDLVDLELEVVPLTEDDVEPLARLRAATGLRMPDCCVLLTAQITGGTMQTTDRALAAQAHQLAIPVVA